jgi:beta-lactamase superfamily II metal-dependent hydrolase
VLKVGHHGSNTTTSDAFLNEVSPSIAIISAGLNNQYKHPHQETLDKLFSRGITVYGTYKSGSIVATANSTTIEFPTDLEPVPEFTLIMVIVSLMVPMLIVVVLHRSRNMPNQK